MLHKVDFPFFFSFDSTLESFFLYYLDSLFSSVFIRFESNFVNRPLVLFSVSIFWTVLRFWAHYPNLTTSTLSICRTQSSLTQKLTIYMKYKKKQLVLLNFTIKIIRNPLFVTSKYQNLKIKKKNSDLFSVPF